jgi:hypothetical protein
MMPIRRIGRRSLLTLSVAGAAGGALSLILGRAEARPGAPTSPRRFPRRRMPGGRDNDSGAHADPEGWPRGYGNCLDRDPIDPANIARCPRKPRRR